MTVCFKIFGDDTTYTFGTFESSLIPSILAALAGRQNVAQLWIQGSYR